MKNYLVVTIDTETDSPRWKPQYPFGLENIKVVPKLQKLFEKYNVKATYLVTYPVAKDKKSVEILGDFLKKQEIEIGAHLHPWSNPPFSSEAEKFKLGYPHLSKLEFEKLVSLTESIEKSFNIKPVSYRAGRYGFDNESLGYLEKLGYLIDTSITPGINWFLDAGPNFAGFNSNQPYFLDSKNIKLPGKSPVLEVPLSIIINRNLPYFFDRAYKSLPLEIKYILRKIRLIKTLWLRPSISSFEEMKYVSDFILAKGQKIVLNMMFHSNELLAGANPYVRTNEEADYFFSRLDKILNYLIFQKNLESKTLSELRSENL
jgi:peptidoglycan/xylan/chitin deacetylase (PgdA/CDA1 family)